MKQIKLYATFLLVFGMATLLVTGSQVFAAEKKAANTGKPPAFWTVRCAKEGKDSDPKRGRCEIFQQLIQKESGKRFVEAAISYPKDKTEARGVFIVPLGVLLPAGMQIKVDDGKPFKFQARYCDNNGCFGYVDLNEKILDSMRQGKKITVSFQARNQKTINVELNLQDFAKALKEVS